MYRIKYQRLSYYEVDYSKPQYVVRNNGGLICPSFWEKFEEHMEELFGMRNGLMDVLIQEMETFTDSSLNRKMFIEQCGGYMNTKAIDTIIEEKKKDIRLLFAKETVFREFRVISESRFKLINPHDLFQELLKLLNEQFHLLKNNAPLSEQTIKANDAKLKAVKSSINKQVPTTETRMQYNAYSQAMKQLNDHGLNVFRYSRMVSVKSFLISDSGIC